MCTINMTFEVPETMGVDLEALKEHIRAYFNLVLSSPTVLKKETTSSDRLTDEMLERFAGCWHGDESGEDIMDSIKEHRTIREPLSL